jgi:AcrR family transcriptional regulator
MKLSKTSPATPLSSIDNGHAEAGLWDNVSPEPARRLLLAALASFAGHGFYGTTTREIAQKAGMSPAALYTHYKSKRELLYRISREAHTFILRRLQATFALEGTPVERVARLVEEFTRFHATYHTAARIAQYELRSLEPEHLRDIVELRTATEAVMHEAIRLGTVSGAFGVDDIDTVTLAVLSLGIDVSRWFNPRGKLTPSELGGRYAALVMRFLGAKSEALSPA